MKLSQVIALGMRTGGTYLEILCALGYAMERGYAMVCHRLALVIIIIIIIIIFISIFCINYCIDVNSIDPDHTPRSVVSDLGLHCLPLV